MRSNSDTDKIFALVAHLGFFTGVGYFFAPLLIWLLKKNSSPFVAHHARQAMIWQGANAVAGGIFFAGYLVLTFMTAGLTLILAPILFLLGLALLIPSIMAAVNVFNDKEYSYPLTGGLAEKL